MIKYLLGLSTIGDKHMPSHSWPDEDVVFVAIDTEGTNLAMSELGIAILDIRDLAAGIRTFNFRCSRRRKDRQFWFGETQTIERHMLSSLLDKVLRTGSLNTDQIEERKVVLVGHSINEDLFRLRYQKLGSWDWGENWSNIQFLIRCSSRRLREGLGLLTVLIWIRQSSLTSLVCLILIMTRRAAQGMMPITQ